MIDTANACRVRRYGDGADTPDVSRAAICPKLGPRMVDDHVLGRRTGIRGNGSSLARRRKAGARSLVALRRLHGPLLSATSGRRVRCALLLA